MLTLDRARVTARCHYCTRRFAATPASDGGPMLEDTKGELCCDDCLCGCGAGHVSEADFEACAEEAAERYADDDMGAFYDDPTDYRLDFPADLEMSS
jgi:hypothetical protein